MIIINDRDLRRFKRKFEERGLDECWPWTAGTDAYGYGKIMMKTDKGFQSRGAHVVAYTITNGPIPKGLLVCHTCDNPACVNPNHLIIGTYQYNMTDKCNKGRHRSPIGEAVGSSKLTEEAISEIKASIKAGVEQKQLANKFGVSPSSICNIVKGRTWSHHGK